MNFITKKGALIVEAAIIFPIIFLTVAGVLSLAIVFYEKVSIQAESHIIERDESMVNGEISNKEIEFIHNIDMLVEAL